MLTLSELTVMLTLSELTVMLTLSELTLTLSELTLSDAKQVMLIILINTQ
jgi:hypothetical protein